jgi:hypothetical protein
MKYFHNSDVEHLGNVAAAAKGFPAANNMDHTMANTCYFHGECAIIDLVPTQTNKGRDRLVSRVKWTTVIRFTICIRKGYPIMLLKKIAQM